MLAQILSKFILCYTFIKERNYNLILRLDIFYDRYNIPFDFREFSLFGMVYAPSRRHSRAKSTETFLFSSIISIIVKIGQYPPSLLL